MDAALLTNPAFWEAAEPFAAGGFDGPLPHIPELDRHVLFKTSGSTGEPKWIALSKNALLLSAACVNRHLHVTEDSRWGLALPIHHVGGFGVVARAFEAACAVHQFPGKWDPARFHAWLGENRITHTSLVPTQVHDLVAAGLTSPQSLSAIVVGGGRLPEETGNTALQLGWPVLPSYGMTETGSQIATRNPGLLDSSYQNGSLPLLDIWEAREGPDGRLEVSGPALFSGILRKEADSWNYHERSSSWHATSDLAAVHDRLLTPLGRADSVVKVLGELVDPESIERELLRLSDGMLVPGRFAVAAVPDPRAGHRLVPIIEIPADRELVLNVLIRYHQHAPGYRRLHPPVFVQLIPRTELGKIRRTLLPDLARG